MRAASGIDGSGAVAGRQLLVKALRGRRRHIGLAIVGATGQMAAMLAVPQIGKRALDDLLADADPRFSTYALALVGLGMVRAATGGLRKHQANALMAGVGVDLRERIYAHLQQLSFSFHDRIGTGQLMARASSDVTAVEQGLSILPFMLQSVGVALVGALLILTIHPGLGAAVVATVAVLGAGAVQRARPLEQQSLALQASIGEYTQYVEQQVNGIRVVKGHGFEGQHRSQGRAAANAIHDGALALARTRARFVSAFVLTPASASIVLLAVGGWLALRRSITPGDLFAFQQYLALLMAPVMVGAQAVLLWPQAQASASRIAEVLESAPDIMPPKVALRLPPGGGGALRFEDIRFGFAEGIPVLDGIDLDVPAGCSVALVGASGSGKSTLALLVARFYDPWSGRVLVDGVPADALDLSELRAAVAMVFEDAVLFTASVRENIAIGRPAASDEDIHRAAALAQADGFIAALPDGYDTVVGEQGASLSGGQRQRIAIARAILRDARVLILDDAMSAIDPGTEEDIRAGLREVMRGRTTLIVAHRLETLALADRAVLIEGGRIVAEGTHEELSSIPSYRRALALDHRVAG